MRRRAGMPVLGICNGFQILCEAGLLPGALIRNASLRFICRDQWLRVENNSTVWTTRFEPDAEILIPMKNAEGCYVAADEVLDELEGEGRVLFRYVGDGPAQGNPNGALAGHRRDLFRGRPDRRPDAASRARHRPAHRPHRRRSRIVLLGSGFHRIADDGWCLMTDQIAHPTAADLLDITDPVGAVDLADLGAALDTVAHAAATPEVEQPYRELGLKDDEYARIREILGRRPTAAELAMYSVMWSEHCSYKSSKVHLAYFGETTTDEMRSKMLAGIGENAGVVDIGDGWAVTFKIESHNHPSFVEPYQGAATGVGGIVRDILAMGARPIAVMDQLRFGPADAADSQRVVPGVVAGVSGYGNSLGLPNIGGEVIFDPSYAGNPLVNAACIGVLRTEDLHTAHASGAGNKIILYGSRTGLDGIGGVSVLASATFAGADGDDSAGRRKLPSVQVGDPFAEKVLIECTLEVFHAGLVVGIQDLGGAGLSCATSELASAGDGGMHIVLDNVPLRAEGMTPAEILSSESQERMCAVVTPDKVDAFLAVCAKWEVQADVIGEVTDGDRLTIEFHGQQVLDVPPRSVAHDGPVYQRPGCPAGHAGCAAGQHLCGASAPCCRRNWATSCCG